LSRGDDLRDIKSISRSIDKHFPYVGKVDMLCVRRKWFLMRDQMVMNKKVVDVLIAF